MFDIENVLDEVKFEFECLSLKDGEAQLELKLFIHGEDHSDLIPDDVRYQTAYDSSYEGIANYENSTQFIMTEGGGADVYYADEYEEWFFKIAPKEQHRDLGYLMYLADKQYQDTVMDRIFPPYFFPCKDLFAEYTESDKDMSKYDPRKDGFPPRNYKMWYCSKVYMLRGKWHGSSKCKDCESRGCCDGVRKIKGYDWVDKRYIEPWAEILDRDSVSDGSETVSGEV